MQLPVFAPDYPDKMMGPFEAPNKARMEGVDLSLVPNFVGSYEVFFWRIGARNFTDSHPPESSWNPQDDGYVWSETAVFDLLEFDCGDVVPFRAAAVHEERESMRQLKAARAVRAVHRAGADRRLRAQ
jgi:hypothetical protein